MIADSRRGEGIYKNKMKEEAASEQNGALAGQYYNVLPCGPDTPYMVGALDRLSATDVMWSVLRIHFCHF